MINIIFGLLVSVVYCYTATEPSLLTASLIAVFSWSYLRFLAYSIALYYAMKVITLNPKLEADFKEAMRKNLES